MSFFSGGYIKARHNYCPTINQHNSYSKLIKATEDCDYNPKCIGVYQQGCNSHNVFRLCTNYFVTHSKLDSCIYKKKELHGMYIMILTQLRE